MSTGRIGELAIDTPRRLYKFLLRQCEKLPKDAQQFYKHSVKQSFKQHAVEPDAERVRQIMEKALSDAEWVVAKYTRGSGGGSGSKK